MIRFMKHYVTDGATKARISYSAGKIMAKQEDGSRVLRDCVSLYAKDYTDALANVFHDHGGYKNDTDIMTDYFETGRVTIFPEDPLYEAALARCRK